MFNSDLDEYDSFNDFADLTEEDYAHIDASIDQPRLTVEIEQEGVPNADPTPPVIANRNQVRQSPLEQFRKNRVLSVTDLVSPAWCEYKFAYGLLQQRSKKIEVRPKIFVSHQGKTMRVNLEVANENDKVTKSGQAIHKKLELEIPKDIVQVNITSPREHWALKLVNMIWSIENLPQLGFIRELMVFGVMDDCGIIGIIDEVRVSEKGSKRTLSISDSKTRRSRSLPPPADTVQSQLQLMLYRRLLSNLVLPTSGFVLSTFWDLLGLDASEPFSAGFQSQLGQVTPEVSAASCLNDLTRAWYGAVRRLGAQAVDTQLTIVYRMREPDEPPKPFVPAQDVAIVLDEPGEANGTPSFEDDPELFWAIQESLLGKNKPKPSDIIGTTEFEYDAERLDKYISHIFEWWNGEREPVGVEVAHSGRCFSCEYREDCEWREKKANEAQERMRTKQAS